MYAGADATAPLQATVCGSTSVSVSVAGTDAYVVFVTGSSNPANLDGFTASYSLMEASPCASAATFIDTSTVLTDGYAGTGYTPGLACDFVLAPTAPMGAITLRFERFELGASDTVCDISLLCVFCLLLLLFTSFAVRALD